MWEREKGVGGGGGRCEPRSTCGPLGTPPYTQTFLMPELAPNLSHSTLICNASSRVGATTSTIGPSPACR